MLARNALLCALPVTAHGRRGRGHAGGAGGVFPRTPQGVVRRRGSRDHVQVTQLRGPGSRQGMADGSGQLWEGHGCRPWGQGDSHCPFHRTEHEHCKERQGRVWLVPLALHAVWR